MLLMFKQKQTKQKNQDKPQHSAGKQSLLVVDFVKNGVHILKKKKRMNAEPFEKKKTRK